MSQSNPPELPRRRDLPPTFDEWVAIILAIATMGFIFFWSFGKVDPRLSLNLFRATPTPAPALEGGGSTPISEAIEDALPSRTSNWFRTTDRDAEADVSDDAEMVSVSPSGAVLRVLPTSPEAMPAGTAAVPLIPLMAPRAEMPPTPGSERLDEGAIATPASPEAATTETQTPAVPLVPLAPPPKTETPAAETAETPAPSGTAATPLLSNVPEDYWAREFVVYFASQNPAIASEDAPFQPDKPVTRAQFASQLQQAFDREDVKPDINFKDLPGDYWANDAIRNVTKRGFLKGYPGEVFRPEQQMTQVEVVVALATGFDLTPPKNPREVLKVYADADRIPQWAVDKVAAATEAGLVVDHPDRKIFDPDEPASQAEAIAMIYQGLVHLGEAEPITSEYIVNP
jgi:hypothetical protein